MSYVVTLVGISHDNNGFEHRQDRCAVAVLYNGSLMIQYLDRAGTRTTSHIEAIRATSWKNLKVRTLNSVYHFEVREGKFDAYEIEAKLLDELSVDEALCNALVAFAKALA